MELSKAKSPSKPEEDEYFRKISDAVQKEKQKKKNKHGVGSLKAHFGISPRVCTNDQTQTMLRVECRTEKENQSQQNTDSWLVLRTLTAGLF